MTINMNISDYEENLLLSFCIMKLRGMNLEEWRDYQISKILESKPYRSIDGFKAHDDGSFTLLYNKIPMYGCTDHSSTPDTNLSMITHIVEEITISEREASARIRILDTKIGSEVKGYLSKIEEKDLPNYIKIIPRKDIGGTIRRIDLVTI